VESTSRADAPPLRRLTGAAVAVALLLLLGCSSGAVRTGATREAVLAALAPYLSSTEAELSAYMRDKGHLGIYLAPNPAWSKERYVAELPAAAEAARMLLDRFPELADVDICADGPWLPHTGAKPYATALKVHLFRDRAAQLPARFATPGDVVAAGLRDQSVDLYVDPQIRVTRAWSEAASVLTKPKFDR
jgi:hypothetical protein